MKNTVNTLLQQKKDGNKITMLTCYDYSTAKLMSRVKHYFIGETHWEIQCLAVRRCHTGYNGDMIHHSAAVSKRS